MVPRVLASLAMGAALVAWTGSVLAEPDAAKALFLEARAQLKAGNVEVACRLFERSFEATPAPGTLLNWGLCEERRGHDVAAWNRLNRFVRMVDASDDRVLLAKRHIASIEPRVGLVRVHVAPDALGELRVLVDGTPLDPGDIGGFFAVEVGDHELQLRSNGRLLHAKKVRLGEAERTDLSLVAVEVPTPEPPRLVATNEPPLVPRAPAGSPREAAPRAPSNTAAVVAGSFAVTGAAASVIFGALVFQQKGIVDDHCQGKRCDDAGLLATERGQRYVSLANVSMVVGVSAALTCGLLLWQSRSSQQQLSASPHGVTVSQRWTF